MREMWQWGVESAVVGDQCLIGGGDYTHDTNAFKDADDFLQMCQDCHGYAPDSVEPGVLEVVTMREDGLWVAADGRLYRILDPAVVKYVGAVAEGRSE
jgi:hypothetical protein